MIEQLLAISLIGCIVILSLILRFSRQPRRRRYGRTSEHAKQGPRPHPPAPIKRRAF